MPNTHRNLRTVTGTVYPAIVQGAGPSDKRMPVKSSDRNHYHHRHYHH